MKLYFVSLMKDKKKSPVDNIVKGILKVLSYGYLLGVRIVDYGYTSGIRKRYKVDLPVISVGNITTGGTGKTPFSLFLADYFIRSGIKPAILIRGYGKDESRQLSDELPDVPIFVGQDRVRNAIKAQQAQADVIILDDGFQHRRLSRDLDILMIDGKSFFGNESLLPRGELREPVLSIRRADMIVITKTDMAEEHKGGNFFERFERIVPGKPVVLTRHKPVALIDTTGLCHSVNLLKGSKVIQACGIGDPDYFTHLIRSLGGEVVLRIDYADHHKYVSRDLEKLKEDALKCEADKVLITKKDFVKIKDLDLSGIEEKLFILDIKIDIVEGKEKLVAGLNSIISGTRT